MLFQKKQLLIPVWCAGNIIWLSAKACLALYDDIDRSISYKMLPDKQTDRDTNRVNQAKLALGP